MRVSRNLKLNQCANLTCRANGLFSDVSLTGRNWISGGVKNFEVSSQFQSFETRWKGNAKLAKGMNTMLCLCFQEILWNMNRSNSALLILWSIWAIVYAHSFLYFSEIYRKGKFLPLQKNKCNVVSWHKIFRLY